MQKSRRQAEHSDVEAEQHAPGNDGPLVGSAIELRVKDKLMGRGDAADNAKSSALIGDGSLEGLEVNMEVRVQAQVPQLGEQWPSADVLGRHTAGSLGKGPGAMNLQDSSAMKPMSNQKQDWNQFGPPSVPERTYRLGFQKHLLNSYSAEHVRPALAHEPGEQMASYYNTSNKSRPL